MELRHLRYFQAVAEQLSFVKAAELLHITQPPLSRQIQELEQEIGTALFVREGKRIGLSPAGEAFRAEVRDILSTLELAVAKARRIGEGGNGPLRIGAVNYLIGKLLPEILGELQKVYPDAKVEIDALPTEAQTEAVRSGRLDFGFVRDWVDTEGLVYEPLGEERLALCFPKDRYRGRSPSACFKQLAELPFIGLNPLYSPGLSKRINEVLQAYGIEPRAAYECNDADTLLNMVGKGMGWAVFSLSYLSPELYPVSFLSLEGSISFGLIHRAGVFDGQARAFRRIVLAKFGIVTEDRDGEIDTGKV